MDAVEPWRAFGLASAKDKTDVVSKWAVQLAARVGYWKAVVAVTKECPYVLGDATARRKIQVAGLTR